jgi:hypothetical protein
LSQQFAPAGAVAVPVRVLDSADPPVPEPEWKSVPPALCVGTLSWLARPVADLRPTPDAGPESPSAPALAASVAVPFEATGRPILPVAAAESIAVPCAGVRPVLEAPAAIRCSPEPAASLAVPFLAAAPTAPQVSAADALASSAGISHPVPRAAAERRCAPLEAASVPIPFGAADQTAPRLSGCDALLVPPAVPQAVPRGAAVRRCSPVEAAAVPVPFGAADQVRRPAGCRDAESLPVELGIAMPEPPADLLAELAGDGCSDVAGTPHRAPAAGTLPAAAASPGGEELLDVPLPALVFPALSSPPERHTLAMAGQSALDQPGLASPADPAPPLSTPLGAGIAIAAGRGSFALGVTSLARATECVNLRPPEVLPAIPRAPRAPEPERIAPGSRAPVSSAIVCRMPDTLAGGVPLGLHGMSCVSAPGALVTFPAASFAPAAAPLKLRSAIRGLSPPASGGPRTVELRVEPGSRGAPTPRQPEPVDCLGIEDTVPVGTLWRTGPEGLPRPIGNTFEAELPCGEWNLPHTLEFRRAMPVSGVYVPRVRTNTLRPAILLLPNSTNSGPGSPEGRSSVVSIADRRSPAAAPGERARVGRDDVWPAARGR